MNIEQLAVEQKPAIQPLWLVIDENGYPIHCASYKEACHEHINDAINDFDIDGASKWRVIEASPKTCQAQEAEAVAEVCALSVDGNENFGEVEWCIEGFKPRFGQKLYTHPPSSQARIADLEADNADLLHDNTEYVSIANEHANDIVQLQATNKKLLDAVLDGYDKCIAIAEMQAIKYNNSNNFDHQYACEYLAKKMRETKQQAIAKAEGKVG